MRLQGRHVLLVLASLLVAGAIGGGFYIMGSPADARVRRLDDRRLLDLRAIARSIDVSWTRHTRLPETLNELATEAGMLEAMRDPVTAVQYEYSARGPEQYQLCAVFARSSTDPANFWSHGAVRHCFDIIVNKVRR